MEWLASPEAWVALATLTLLEIVLGVDNIIFLSILVARLPAVERAKARSLGLALAMLCRIALLLSLSWVMTLTTPLFTILGEAISGRDIILIGGGIFLLAKSTFEIHNSLEAEESQEVGTNKVANFFATLVQIAILDIVFSLDSVITAVGLSQHLAVMVIAIVLAVVVMMLSAAAIGVFIDTHPTIKMLALSFLILVGVTLTAEGLDFHIPKGYIYFSMAFSFGVEILNQKIRKKVSTPPVHLRKQLIETE